jgi:hypothetical protein
LDERASTRLIGATIACVSHSAGLETLLLIVGSRRYARVPPRADTLSSMRRLESQLARPSIQEPLSIETWRICDMLAYVAERGG